MSKSKQRARAEREAQQQAVARARAAQRKQSGPQPSRPAPAPPRRGKQPVYRQRRFPPLPWQLKVALALGWLAVQVVVFFTIDSIGTRIALGIISLFALPLLVVILRDPSRRPAR